MKGIICEVVRCQRVAASAPKRAKTVDEMMREFEERRAASAGAPTDRGI